MRFKVKDLMIAVLPEAGQPGQESQLVCNPTLCVCTRCTECTLCSGCTCTGCTQCTGCTGCTPCTDCTGCTACTNGCTVCTFNSGCGGASCGCTGATGCNICSQACTACTDLTCGGFASKAPLESLVAQPESLALLKEQLRSAMAQVEEQERALDERMAPQSLADVDALEKKLLEALDELRARRETLQKRSAG